MIVQMPEKDTGDDDDVVRWLSVLILALVEEGRTCGNHDEGGSGPTEAVTAMLNMLPSLKTRPSKYMA